jgi:hypothetical protein
VFCRPVEPVATMDYNQIELPVCRKDFQADSVDQSIRNKTLFYYYMALLAE